MCAMLLNTSELVRILLPCMFASPTNAKSPDRACELQPKDLEARGSNSKGSSRHSVAVGESWDAAFADDEKSRR